MVLRCEVSTQGRTGPEVGVAVSRGEEPAHGARSAAVQEAGEQGLLFGSQVVAGPDNMGYRGPTACAAAGITYRQLDYWARTGLVQPTVRPAAGSGSQRLYGFRDIQHRKK